IPRSGRMLVDALLFGTDGLIGKARQDGSLDQLVNVASLPGIAYPAMAMPDIHRGYGFPIGGVAATDWEGGVISPGGVGYDINCGVRLYVFRHDAERFLSSLDRLLSRLFEEVPSGVGSTGGIRLSSCDFESVLEQGSAWAAGKGYGHARDLESTEDGGVLEGAGAGSVSNRALERGRCELGTLGSGNHFAEIGLCDMAFEPAAGRLSLTEGLFSVSVHCGSRGLGHQVCDDYIGSFMKSFPPDRMGLPDRELVCAPLSSDAGRKYLSAMRAAANYAYANRQIVGELVRRSIEKALGRSPDGWRLVYDVAHNIAKEEIHVLEGGRRARVCVHRKGATRAFPAGREELSGRYRATGQPVIVPGSMGDGVWVMLPCQRALELTLGSSCHGAGRLMSRTAARRSGSSGSVVDSLRSRGILVAAASRRSIVEERPSAYKSVDEVLSVMLSNGIAEKAAHFRPLVVLKG
ncbi:RtcB family protein, partial [Candidatus Fermentibacterales bacterium]|nr:RtcB family protein [Candidatus Fermentibacterales bacterium]